jgi:uncharacterized protein (TIGR02001 family)
MKPRNKQEDRRKKMKKKMIGFAAALALVSGLSLPGSAAAEGEASASLGVYSNYVWRGQTLSDGVVAQPTVGISYKGFGANLWSNYDGDTEQMVETDFTLNYAGSAGKLGYDVGFIYYGLDTVKDTHELYLGLSYDVLLSPSATLYWDTDQGDGGFLVLAIGHSFPVTETISIDLGADVTANFDNAIMGAGEDGEVFTGFYNADLTVATSIPFAGAWSVDALLAYSFPLSSDAEAAIAGASLDGEDSVFWGGLGVTLGF